MEIVNVQEANAITHSGVFHADEVFATYILSNVIDDLKVARSNIVPENFEGIVYDVGKIYDPKNQRFDHHQKEGAGDRNGVKYASAGLIWKEYGKSFLLKKGIEQTDIERVFKKVDKEIIQNIDGIDNGQKDLFSGFTINAMVSTFNPNWDEKTNPNESFKKAVNFIDQMMSNYIEREKSVERASIITKNAIENAKDGIIELDQFVPWQTEYFETPEEKTHDLYYVIFPSNRGGYNIQTIPIEFGSFQNKQLFPEEWRGKTNKELKEITGIADINFIHNAGFIGTTNSKESARLLAYKSMKENLIKEKENNKQL